MAGWLQALSEPEGVSPRWKALDSTHQFVAVPFIEGPGLKVVGEVDGLAASTVRRLGFGRGDEPGRKSATSEAWVHPEVLKFATVAPGPSAYAGHH